MIEQDILDQQTGGDQLRMLLQALPGVEIALADLLGKSAPLLTHLLPGSQYIGCDIGCVQRLLARLDGTLQLSLFGLTGLLQAAITTEHAGRQIAVLLHQRDEMQHRPHRLGTTQLTLGLAAARQRT
ncbi:hypothetical protein D9M70_589370 [compost metagenome]